MTNRLGHDNIHERREQDGGPPSLLVQVPVAARMLGIQDICSGRGGTRTPDICLVRATVPVALEQRRTETPGHSVSATWANTCVQERTREIRGNKQRLTPPSDGFDSPQARPGPTRAPCDE